jgi:hypothetical protein
MRMQSTFLLAEFPKSSGQNGTSQTGYETWIYELGKKSFVNMDVVASLRKTSPAKPKIEVGVCAGVGFLGDPAGAPTSA